VPGVARQDVLATVLIKINDLDIRDLRRLRRTCTDGMFFEWD
jgi:hypothetical protein